MRIQFLKEAQPSLVFEIEHMHVVELLCHLVDSSIDDHKVVVNLRSMSTSWKGLLTSDLNLVPLVSSQIEFPSVAQLLIFVILTTVDVHVVPGVIISDNG